LIPCLKSAVKGTNGLAPRVPCNSPARRPALP